MRKVSLLALTIALTLFTLVAGCTRAPQATAEIDGSKLEMFGPLPRVAADDPAAMTAEKVALGRMLYYEPRLSKSQTISCNTCHDLNKYGVDGTPTSTGFKSQKGNRNAPTVYNAAGHFAQFWDGRAPDVEAQAKGPMLNPVEMAMGSDKDVVRTLKSMPGYVQAFQRAFPNEKDPVTFDNAAKAIGVFERGLITPSRWDKYLAGDNQALTAEEKAGFNTYMDTGCQACHAGPYVGGNAYQKMGAMKPWPDAADPGRYQVTQSEADRMVFKVPSLRNIARTSPYFHNGRIATLDEAVANMAQYQLGKTLKPEQVKSISTWLQTLTGDIPSDYIKPPELPKATAKTPKPVVGD